LVGCQECCCRAGRCIICESLIDYLASRRCPLKRNLTTSVTIPFSISTAVYIYSPSVRSGWNAVFIPPTVTVSSVMACRLFRELKLGIIIGPMTEGAISKLVFRDMGTITLSQAECSFELHTINDMAHISGEGNHSHRSIDLEDLSSDH
jgi:hypothetical protein